MQSVAEKQVQNSYSLHGKRVYVAGHKGMVGAAILRALGHKGCGEIQTATRAELDLLRQDQVEHWMAQHRPQVIFLAAAKVGGIHANQTYPADFLYENLMIEANIIQAAARYNTEKLVFLGSSCIYPKFAEQPISEEALLTGPLEPTNEAYAIAKIAGIKLAQAYRQQYGCDFISAMPTNLYGPGDQYNLQTSHVIPALLRKAHEACLAEASTMEIWGTGTARREFIHCEDCADAIIFLAEHYSSAAPVNIGVGQDISILELAQMIADIAGFKGKITHDLSKPDGTPRKLMNSSLLFALGWKPKIPLKAGLAATYKDVFVN